MDRIEAWRSSYSFTSPPSLVLARKLKALKEDLKQWNYHVFGNVSLKQQQLFCDLEALDRKEGLGGLSPSGGGWYYVFLRLRHSRSGSEILCFSIYGERKVEAFC